MIYHVWQRAMASGAESVVIATDSEKVRLIAEGFGAKVCMTSPDHPSGTDRLAEVVVALGLDDDEIIVNLQGDEPMMPKGLIRAVAENLTQHENVKMSTLCAPITDIETLFNPDVVKVTMNKRGFALYFSRAPIPWERDAFRVEPREMKGHHFQHIGIYAYRVSALNAFLLWDQSPAGRMESLEQLRILWHGGRIHVLETQEAVPLDVNTQADLDRVRALMKGR
jgi:3-deoxy-manno-octulosonate cytidylyltransferase (CMP-KDO synthetase)